MFNLSRYFSTLSFILIVLAAGAMGPLYRHLALQQMSSLAEDRNVAMARVIRNALWSRFLEPVNASYGMDPVALRTLPEMQALREPVEVLMRDTAVVDIRIFNRLGTTVFSTNPRQIGDSLRDDGNFRLALAGEVASRLVHRPQIDTGEGRRTEVDVLSSYIPIVGKSREVEGVLELYQDVTPFMAQVNRTLWWVTAGIAAIFGALYLMQFLVVRRAHLILKLQDVKISAARATLELQVEQRTSELKRTNRKLEAEIAERRQAEDRLHYLAHHDPLTGLSNRRSFLERLQASMHEVAEQNHRLAVLFIDLDQFKQVNDSLGHTVGDELLVAVAARLSEHMGPMDMLCRLGGDEFICLMDSVGSDDEVAQFAGDINAACERPFMVSGHELFVTTSIGICLYPGDGVDVTELMRNADTAMYRAKAMGRGHYHFYTPEMTQEAQEHIRLEGLLRRALDNDELEVHLQQQVDARTGRLTGAEALVRWKNAEFGSIPPTRFIALAEESGLIIGLGTWVLRETCRQVMEWRAAGFDLPQVSVNLSVKQLERPEFIDTLLEILDETGLEPQRLKLEITESVVMTVDNAFALLDRLRKLGISLALDDFGTGYSSLNYLKLLPIQQLKIDRSFVMGIGRNSGDEAIIRTIMALARSLDLEVVAEGVETQAQAEFLQALGCEHLQGFLHGMPAAPEVFRARWAREC